MSLQTDQRTDLEILTDLGLDYAFDPPCEHMQHNDRGRFGHRGPGWAYIERLEPCGCDWGSRFFYLCKGGWEDPGAFFCPECYAGPFTREQVWRLVALVRP